MKPSALLILILPLLAGCGAEQHQDDARAGEVKLSDPLFAAWARRRPEH